MYSHGFACTPPCWWRGRDSEARAALRQRQAGTRTDQCTHADGEEGPSGHRAADVRESIYNFIPLVWSSYVKKYVLGKQFNIKRFICLLLDQKVPAAQFCLYCGRKWVRKLVCGRSDSKNLRNLSEIELFQTCSYDDTDFAFPKAARNLALKIM